jgi:hypothetical protein
MCFVVAGFINLVIKHHPVSSVDDASNHENVHWSFGANVE